MFKYGVLSQPEGYQRALRSLLSGESLSREAVLRLRRKYRVHGTAKLDVVASSALSSKLNGNWPFFLGGIELAFDALDLNWRDREEARRLIGLNLLEEQLRGAVEDREIDTIERRNLREIRNRFSLGDDDVRQIYEQVCIPVMQTVEHSVLADGKLSPEEETRFRALASGLGVRIRAETEAVFDRARALWSIENGDLPVVASPILLRRGEQAHGSINAKFFEERSRRRSETYAGLAGSFKVAKGVRIPLGYIVRKYNSESYEHFVGGGTLVATSRRLQFSMEARSVVVMWPSVIEIEPYSDGVVVKRSTGKSLTFRYVEEDPAFTALVSRLASEMR